MFVTLSNVFLKSMQHAVDVKKGVDPAKLQGSINRIAEKFLRTTFKVTRKEIRNVELGWHFV